MKVVEYVFRALDRFEEVKVREDVSQEAARHHSRCEEMQIGELVDQVEQREMAAFGRDARFR
jgi:hypothetical protein